MSRQNEIEKIHKMVMFCRQPEFMAEYLVDNGIGSADRFEIKTILKHPKYTEREIVPIDYKEEQNG